MDPYRPLVIDNRPTLPVFYEGSPMTDGMANFAAALINAPQAAAQVRHQRERQQLEDLWKEREWDRTEQQDALNRLWGNQDRSMRQKLNQAQIDNLSNDNARAWAEDLGKAATHLFGGGSKGGGVQRSGWSNFTGADGKAYLYHRGTGQVMLADPSKGKLDADGNVVPGSIPPPTAKAAPPAGGGFWDMHRSGAPGAAQTAGDVLGLRWYGPGEGAPPDAPAAHQAAAGTPEIDMAEVGHHAQNIAELLKSGDRAAAQNWIAQMRAQHGEEFAEAVKQQIRALNAPAQAP